MSSNLKKLRSALLAGAGTALMTGMGTSPVLANPVASQQSTQSITVNQQYNVFSSAAQPVVLSGNTYDTILVEVTNDAEDEFALEGSTITVGTSASEGNVSLATGYANSADLTVNADLNNVTGSGYGYFQAVTDGITTGATVSGSADMAVALSQQNNNVTAFTENFTGLGVSLSTGAVDSTVTIAGNRVASTAVLNSGTTLLDASANNSTASLGTATAQSGVGATLSASISSLAQFATGSSDSDIALENSTVALAANSQTATAVGNSGSNRQIVEANDLGVDGEVTTEVLASTLVSASGGYVTAVKQEIAESSATQITSSIDSDAGVTGFRAVAVGDVIGSTISNEGNSASALARGNEVANNTTLSANSIATGALNIPNSQTVVAVGSSQEVTGNAIIIAEVTGDGDDGPLVETVIDGVLGSGSAITTTGNAINANAAGNRAGSVISVAATNIETRGSENGEALPGNADSAFALVSSQTVGDSVQIAASLTDDWADPEYGTSISTWVDETVIESRIASTGYSITAAASGNQTLSGGNAITLTGTNIATGAALSNGQSTAADINVTIGSAGVEPVQPGNVSFVFTGSSTGSAGNYTFVGTASGTQADRDALAAAYPSLTFTFEPAFDLIRLEATNQLISQTSFAAAYATGGNAGSPASGGVLVRVGEDIIASDVLVDGNTTSGRVTGNSAANSIAMTATNLTGDSTLNSTGSTIIDGGLVQANADAALSSAQYVESDGFLDSLVGGTFVISAEGTSAGDLSDVDASSLAVTDNVLTSTITGNSAANAVDLKATQLSNTSAIASRQQMDADVDNAIDDFSGAFVTIGRDVLSSSVAVDGNSFIASTVGNEVANTLAVAGSSSVYAGDFIPTASAQPLTLDGRSAIGDHALNNEQVAGNISNLVYLETSVEATYGINTLGLGASSDADDVSDVVDSSLSVSGNVQSASTLANDASNLVDISGGTVVTNAALLSSQTGRVSLEAYSYMAVEAPAANTGSTLAMNGNSNTSTGTINNAENAMAVTAATKLGSTTTGSQTEGTSAVLSGDQSTEYNAIGDYVVNNYQLASAGGYLNVVADSTIVNADIDQLYGQYLPTDGIQQSSVTVSGNANRANAIANQAVNALDLTANTLTASGGVVNQQANATSVSAQSWTNVGLMVGGYDGGSIEASPINASAATIADNVTASRAGGNSATNALSVDATTVANASNYGAAVVGATRTDSVYAGYAVLNEQSNRASVAANAAVTYGAGFEAAGDVPSVANSAVAVNGNSATAVAYGNAVSNALTFAVLNSPATGAIPTAALASNQYNSGPISASVGSIGPVTLGIAATGGDLLDNGPVSQSSLAINGNTLSATAYGNSASNTLTITGNNLNVAVLRP
jgi:hypothetical protein